MVIMTSLSVLGVAAFVSLIICTLETKWYNSFLSAVILGLVIFFAVRDTVGIDETVFNDCRVIAVKTVSNHVCTKVELPSGEKVYAEGMIPNAMTVDVKMEEYPLTGLIVYSVVIPDQKEVTATDPEPPVPSEDLLSENTYETETMDQSVGR